MEAVDCAEAYQSSPSAMKSPSRKSSPLREYEHSPQASLEQRPPWTPTRTGCPHKKEADDICWPCKYRQSKLSERASSPKILNKSPMCDTKHPRIDFQPTVLYQFEVEAYHHKNKNRGADKVSLFSKYENAWNSDRFLSKVHKQGV